MSDDSIGEDDLARFVEEGWLVGIVGPTASGKTNLAARLAERVGGEVVNVDSVQIYKRFDIGSGKPTPDELGRAPHHLVSVVDPLEPIDAARYAALATTALDDARARGKPVIVCGGTFLWVKALVYGLAHAPAASPDIRARHKALADAEGRAALHRRLSVVDPASAARLHPNDLLRVSRALEVYELTGETLSAVQSAHGFRAPRHPVKLVARKVPPDALTERIATRAKRWLDEGWVDEVRGLIDQGYGDARAMGSVGYKEVRAHLRGEIPCDLLADAIVRATRVFARRQRTWLNRAEITWLGG